MQANRRISAVLLTCISLIVLAAAVLYLEKRRPDPSSGQLAGPAHQFRLGTENAQLMQGKNDAENERWCDVAGNYYAPQFIQSFSYSPGPTGNTQVWVSIEPRGRTLKGRLEGHGLKPNFAYQMKLLGDFEDRTSFERIGGLGRWRLSGRGVNYSREQYEAHGNKRDVESYILFDFFVTDGRGSVEKDFDLQNSYHVVRNENRDPWSLPVTQTVSVFVRPEDPAIYARPKQTGTEERIGAERHGTQRIRDAHPIQLPAGRYRAVLALTEESFHSEDRDGGYWATPLTLPIEFKIVAPGGPVAFACQTRSGSKS